MAHWELPGNQDIAQRLRSAAARGALTHALLFTGSGDGLAAAQYAAAAFQCNDSAERPCGRCEACRKVREGIHPDVTIVKDDEHKNISVDVIRSVRADAWIRPNEGNRKVYIFPDCSILTEPDQNILLKVVEEGPPYAAFCFCAENAASILTTLRSRCVELKLRPAEAAGEAAVSDNAAALCSAIALRKPGRCAELLVRLEKAKCSREELQTLLEDCIRILSSALLLEHGRKGPENAGNSAANLAKNLTKPQIMRTIELLQTYRKQCFYNVSAAQVLGAVTVELEVPFD